MTYSVKIFHRATGLFHAYLDLKGRSEWKTRSIAAKHGREFAKRFPEFLCALEDDAGNITSTINGYSYSKDKGLHLYTDASSLHIPHDKLLKVAKLLGLACIDHTEWLGLTLVAVVYAHKEALQ